MTVQIASLTTGLALTSRIADLRAAWADKAAKRNVYRTTLAELSALTDRDLADLGLSRFSIIAVAREAAYGK